MKTMQHLLRKAGKVDYIHPLAKSPQMDHEEESDEPSATAKSSSRIQNHNKNKLDEETQRRVAAEERVKQIERQLQAAGN